MTMLTDLADACRASGLDVVEGPHWTTLGHGDMSGRPRSIVLHHTAGPRKGDAPSLGIVTTGRPDLAGPLAHIVLARSGTVHIVAAGLCWHAGVTWTPDQSNGWAIGIEAEATGVDPWPEVQYQAYLALVRALCEHYGIDHDAVQGHKEVCRPRGRKSDPNFDCDAFRDALGHAPAHGPAPKPVAPRRPNQEEQSMDGHSTSPPRDPKGVPTTAKSDWPSTYVVFGFVPGQMPKLHIGGAGGWIHSATWWVRDSNWTANLPKHHAVPHNVGPNGSERFVGYSWEPTPPAGADELEITFSAPDGYHLFAV